METMFAQDLNSDLELHLKKIEIENLRRVANVAKLFSDRGQIVLCSFISPLKSQRENIKKIIGEEDFHLVYINTSLKACEARDPKGLYQKAREGKIPNFTGIDSPYEEPSHSHLIINTENKELADNAQELINYIKKNF
jgi:adenylylsulfate kinase